RSCLASQPRVDRARGALGAAHGLDHGGAAADGVAGGEVPRVARAAVLVDADPAALELEALDPRDEIRARHLADRLDRRVGGDDVLAARHRLGAPAAALVAGSELHPHAL